MNVLKLKDFEIGNNKLTILAGPCAAESMDILRITAEGLKKACEKLNINYVFKSSFDKANRSSITSYRGPGLEKGLEMLSAIKKEFDLPIVTDIHLPEQAAVVAEVADILQIPAFLCRQTDLLVAAAKTGKIVNIKKGQFLAPQQMGTLVKKVEDAGNHQIMLTDRGATFGYGNLVVDFRAVPIMKEFGYPVVFDSIGLTVEMAAAVLSLNILFLGAYCANPSDALKAATLASDPGTTPIPHPAHKGGLSHFHPGSLTNRSNKKHSHVFYG